MAQHLRAAERVDQNHRALVSPPREARLTLPVLVGLAVFGVLIVAWATARGVGLSPDSVAYGYAADSLVAHGHLSYVLGGPITLYPPGLSILLAGVHALGPSVSTAARGLDVLSIALLVPVAYRLGLDACDSWAVGLFVAAASVLSTATTMVFTMMWTEPPFIVITTGVLLLLVRAVRDRRLGGWSAVGIAVGVSVAVGLRLTGVSLIPLVPWVILAATRSIWRAAAVTAGSCAGLIAVALRNLALGASPLGHQGFGTGHAAGLAGDSLVALGSLFVPRFGEPLGGILLLAMAAASVAALVRRQSRVVLLVSFVAIFWLLLWYGEVSTAVDPVDIRLVVPALPAMAVICAYGASLITRRAAQVVAMVAMVAMLLLASALIHNARVARAESTTSFGYNSPTYRHSALIGAVRPLPTSAVVASNDPAAVAWLAKRGPVLPVPEVGRYMTSAQASLQYRRLAQALHHSGGYLAIFDEQPVSRATHHLASDGIDCHRLHAYSDGSLYVCSAP